MFRNKNSAGPEWVQIFTRKYTTGLKVLSSFTDSIDPTKNFVLRGLAYGANYRTVPIIEQKNTEKFHANIE